MCAFISIGLVPAPFSSLQLGKGMYHSSTEDILLKTMAPTFQGMYFVLSRTVGPAGSRMVLSPKIRKYRIFA
ncbi:hypothetical protein, partial [Klebsiella pneumoniae]|uniref:hypothetical protein n=1 Tax=Klebsiella pneumoniae TaxID=573 RepID=UPI003EBEDA58